MIYSKSAEYAIRATIHLAKLPDDQHAMAKDIAHAEDIPAPFLAKILQELARKGVLHSVKGPSGGFRLKKKPGDVRLLDVVGAIDGVSQFGRCIEGHAQCPAKNTCPLHDSWMPLHSSIMEFLERNTIGGLVKLPVNGKQKAAKRTKKPGESRKAVRTSV